MALECSLSPKENKTLVEMVGHPAVKIYYDFANVYIYGHGNSAVSGIELLGKEWIAAVHAKNEGRLLEEEGRIDWRAALGELTKIAYDGWVIFETRHRSHEECREMTHRNIDFIKRHFRPPSA